VSLQNSINHLYCAFSVALLFWVCHHSRANPFPLPQPLYSLCYYPYFFCQLGPTPIKTGNGRHASASGSHRHAHRHP
jgi:hypothetical protein